MAGACGVSVVLLLSYCRRTFALGCSKSKRSMSSWKSSQAFSLLCDFNETASRPSCVCFKAERRNENLLKNSEECDDGRNVVDCSCTSMRNGKGGRGREGEREDDRKRKTRSFAAHPWTLVAPPRSSVKHPPVLSRASLALLAPPL